jgi:monofunctional biosynthetic peptidoglycan transglycosylase
MNGIWRTLGRLIVLLLLSALALQVYFLLRIALMAVVDPQSTTFQRSEAWRVATESPHPAWSQTWVPYSRIAVSLKRAVIASEDAGFVDHSGVEWDAIEKAMERNQLAESRAEKANERLQKQQLREAARGKAKPLPAPRPAVVPRIVGGSTITQQLAKNLFLDGERQMLRKAQEFVITYMLEALLSKQLILELYLNSVEWGEGVFGAEAAARHYFHAPASQLAPWQAARLAVMLPSPKRFETRAGSAYLMSRASTVSARMNAVDVP